MATQVSACDVEQSSAGRDFPPRPFWLQRWLSSLARRRRLAVLLVGVVSLAARALLLPILPIPKPAIQDEFSYLLAADTFASGRLANPTPSLAEHFETLQVILHPTYASKYPPFSGLVMAFGQKLAGEPWIGVWLATGVLCATLCWALQGWLPPLWALAGSLIALARIGIVSYWSESYWGGTCAAIGGALVIGALPRLIRGLCFRSALALSAGLAILANTRPYEGLVLACACLGYLAFTLARRPVAIGRLARNLILPMALLLAPVFAWMAYYNYRVTGHPLEMPYVAHEKQYAVWSPLLWQTHPNAKPVYSNTFLEDFWTVAAANENQSSRGHWLKAHVSDIITLGHFFLGWPLVVCMIGFARPLWRDPAARCALVIVAGFYAGTAWDARLFPHYAAPATALAYILAACALRAVRNAWPGTFAERLHVTWGVIAMFVLTTGMGLLTPENRFLFGPIDYHVRAERASIVSRLQNEPGEQLVLVHYGIHHDLYEELVFNRADIDGSKIVWARSLGPERDSRLLRHYSGRQAWLLEEDGEVKLKRYVACTEGTMPTQLQIPLH